MGARALPAADLVVAPPTKVEVEGAWVDAACAPLVAAACDTVASTLASHFRRVEVEGPKIALLPEDTKEVARAPGNDLVASPCTEVAAERLAP